jgi:Alr-MurF fusion protein
MVDYSLSKIAEIIGGSLSLCGNDISIQYLLIDSRKIHQTENVLFFAISGERHDGHQYIEKLIQKGIKNFVIDKDIDQNLFLKANFIKVDNVLDSLQKLAQFHRLQHQIPIVGITGSNGKTIIKEWIYQLLKDHYHIVRNPKSYNSQVGVPLSVWQINKTHQLGLFEAGISTYHEMEKLEAIIKPTIGIFSTIGFAHLENFNQQSDIVEEKIKLFKNSQIIIYAEDYELIHQSLNRHFNKEKLFGWSTKNKDARLFVEKIDKRIGNSDVFVSYLNQSIHFNIPFTDTASIENAIHCLCLVICLNQDIKNILPKFGQLMPVSMRLEQKHGNNNCTIINDSYNADIGSLQVALDFIEQQLQHQRKTIILSDIYQSGKEKEELYNDVAKLIHQKNIYRMIGIGPEICTYAPLFQIKQKYFFNNTKDFLAQIHQFEFKNETILIKGARAFSFEKISKILESKVHETIMEIDLNAIVHNLNFYKSLIDRKTKIMAMVKAFSYGSGGIEIANVLQFNHVDYLAVAFADEGAYLREKGISLPILVLNSNTSSFDTIIKHYLEPEIFSFKQFDAFLTTISHEIATDKLPYPISIKIDTGMNRLGFTEDDIEQLIQKLQATKLLRVKTIFSHLVASENNIHDDFSNKQIQLFETITNKMEKGLNYKCIKHILNSGGIERFPKNQYDMVRLGIGLYGISSSPEMQKNLKQVSTLKTTISQIKNVKKGDSVGYNRSEILSRNSKIATVAIGYADGYNRKFSKGKGKMFINGMMAPVVGNVCMDMTMLDVTGIDCKEGDDVIVFGKELSIHEFAQTLDTIPYEVLTSISERIKRIYIQE